MEKFKKLLKWILLIIVLVMFVAYVYFYHIFELFPGTAETVLEFYDSYHDKTFIVYSSGGNALDYEAISVHEKQKGQSSKLIVSFEKYDYLYGFSLYGKDSLQIVLESDFTGSLDTFYIDIGE